MKIGCDSGSQWLQTADILRHVHTGGNDDRKLAGDAGEKYIRLGGCMITGVFSRDPHVGLEMVDRPLNGSPYLIEGVPFRGVPLDAGEHTEVHVFVSVGGAPFPGGAAWFLTVADPLSFYHMHLGAAPFHPVRTALFPGDAAIAHIEGRVIGTGRIAVFIEPNLLERAFIPRVVRDECFAEAKIVFKRTVDIRRVKSGVAQEGIRVEMRMSGKEIGKDGSESGGITDGLIFFRGIGFLLHREFGMALLERIVKEDDITDDAESVGKDGELVGIAEMAVDVHLFRVRAGSGMGRHKSISHLVRIDVRSVLIEGLERFDEGIESLRIVFGDKKFNAGGIKGKDGGKGRINELADRLGEIDHLAEHKLDIREKVLSETGKERGIGNLVKAAEIPEFPAEGKEKDEQGVSGDRKDLLKDECGKEPGERISPVPAQALVKGISKDRRDEFMDIEMFFEELEERRGIINEQILTVGKGIFK